MWEAHRNKITSFCCTWVCDQQGTKMRIWGAIVCLGGGRVEDISGGRFEQAVGR